MTETRPAAAVPATTTGTLRVRFFAAARAAAGTDEEVLALPAAPAPRAEVERLLAERHPDGHPPLAEVLARSSFLLDGVACPDPQAPVPAGAVLDVLPPFSGG